MDWSSCSADIMLLIFTYLDHKDLTNCLFVCKTWRDLVYYFAGVKEIWRKLAKLTIHDKGVAYKQRSILPWKELWFNSLLWYDGNVQLQVDKILEFNQFKNMHIFEDNIFIINESGMKQYKVDTFVQILEQTCVTDYQKTQYITAKLTDRNDFFLVTDNKERVISKDCCKFKLVEDCCFTIDQQNVINLFKMDGDSIKQFTLMRSYDYFGSVCSINIYIDEVYVLKRNGNILRADSWYFIDTIIGKINSPHFYNNPLVMCIFLKHSVIYSVRSEDGSKTIKVSEIGDTGEIAVECSGMSCATAHGDVLLVGYEDGEVRVYLAKTLLVNKEPIFKLNIKDVAKCTLKDVAVKNIEVYEAKNSHYLFIATQHELLKVIVTYNN